MMMTKKKRKLKKILNRLSPKPEPKVEIREVVKVVERIVEKPIIKKDTNLPFLLTLAKKFIKLSNTQKKSAVDFKEEIKNTEKSFETKLEEIENKIPQIPEIPEVDLVPLEKRIEDLEEDFEEKIKKERIEMLYRLQNIGGGGMNRQIFIGGANPLEKYTDINLKPGSNISLTYQNNETTKKVDITFNVSSVQGGTVRSINTISTSQTAGSVMGTDYVYLCAAGLKLDLPPALSNKNLYTIKNISNSSVLVSTTGADTIDDDPTVIMPIKFTSVDLVGNETDKFNIT